MKQKLIRRMEFPAKTSLKMALSIADSWVRRSEHDKANRMCSISPNGKLVVEIFEIAGNMNEEEARKVAE